MLKLDQITVVQIELTTRCNARCPMCMRNYRGLDYNSGYPDTELTIDNIRHIFYPKLLAQLKQNLNYGINFNGNLGDFCNARDSVEIVEYFVSAGVKININTNGSARNPAWWQRLALPGVHIGFAIDGLEDTHHLYRQDTDWYRVIQNARAFISAGGSATWRFVPFDHNRHQEAECRRLSQEWGFVEFKNIHAGRDTGPVYSRTGEFVHWLGKPRDDIPPIKDMLHSHNTWFDAKTIKIAKDTAELNLKCVHIVNKEIYLAADGTVYPCCYLGFYPGQMNHAGNEELKHLIKENNALEYDLEHCLAWFDRVQETWSQPSIATGRTYACVSSCNQLT